MTCKDCVHYEVCAYRASQFKSVGVEVDWDEKNSADICFMSRSKSRFVELPCEVGQTVYYLVGKEVCQGTIDTFQIDVKSNWYIAYCKTDYDFTGEIKLAFWEFGKTVFLSREDAENALLRKEDEGK